MSFTEPLSVTIAPASAVLLPRINSGKENASEYVSADSNLHVEASHQYGTKRTRRMLRLDVAKVAPDAFRPAENVKVTMGIYMVFDVPQAGGFTNTEILAAYTGYKTLITASSDALITKLIGGES